jgi:hypothetical protein
VKRSRREPKPRATAAAVEAKQAAIRRIEEAMVARRRESDARFEADLQRAFGPREAS